MESKSTSSGGSESSLLSASSSLVTVLLVNKDLNENKEIVYFGRHASSGSDEKVEVSDIDAEPIVGRIVYLREALCLMENLQEGEVWNVRLRNLERWRVRPSDHTIDFEVVDSELEKAYMCLQQDMTRYYKNPSNSETQLISLGTILERKYDLAVLQTENGNIKRVKILYAKKNEAWSDFDNGDMIEALSDDENNIEEIYDPDEEEEDDDGDYRNLPLRLLLGDEGNGVEFNPSKMKLFYMLDRFASLPFKTRELYLKDTDHFEGLNVFRDGSCNMLNETYIYKCFVETINMYRIPFVTLRTPKFEKTVNCMLCIKAAASLPKPCAPPVGKTYGHAILVHMELNGEVFVQFKDSNVNDIFKSLTTEYLTKEKYELAKAKGPYELEFDKFYVAPYDHEFYRCRLSTIFKDKPEVYVYYIDYGNYESVMPEDLVPCEVISDVFNAMGPQALRAHLHNIGNCNVNSVFKKLAANAVYTVETVDAGLKSRLIPTVELLTTKGGELLVLSEDILKSKFADRWGSASFPSKAHEILTKSVATCPIPLGGLTTNWSNSEVSPVFAEPGAIIEVEVLGLHSTEEVHINPVPAKERMKKFEIEIASWKGWEYLTMTSKQELRNFHSHSMEVGSAFIWKKQEQQQDTHYRVRVCKLNSGGSGCKVLAHIVDTGNVVDIDMSNMYPAHRKFFKLPPQAAKLKILSGFSKIPHELHGRLSIALSGTRFLVKVDKVWHDEYGVCWISGHLHHRFAMKKGDSGESLHSIQSLNAEQVKAKNIQLGEPLTFQAVLGPGYRYRPENLGNLGFLCS